MPVPTYPPRVPFGICPECGGHLVERTNRDDGNKFIGCSKYPKCTYVERDDEEQEDYLHDLIRDIYFGFDDATN
jgi:ssDNA-binding Zn-finger/Zn-ribbon topoisomerase 1